MSFYRFSTLLVASSLLLAAPAQADVPPPDSCNRAGETCDTAPPDYKTRGTCTAKKCQKVLPVGDGAVRPVEYDCMLCVASAGAGGAMGSGGSSSTAGAAGTAAVPESEDSGCAVSPGKTGPVLASLLLIGGALALFTERRSRRR